MNDQTLISGYQYSDAKHNCSHSYLLPKVMAELKKLKVANKDLNARLFDLGCGMEA